MAKPENKRYKTFWDYNAERNIETARKEAEPFIKEMSKLFKQSG